MSKALKTVDEAVETPAALVVRHAWDTFGSKDRAEKWLNRPSRVFEGLSPIEVLETQPEKVEEALVRIDHGMFL